MKMIKLKILKKAEHPFESFVLNAMFMDVNDAVYYGIQLLQREEIESVMIDKKGYQPIILNKKNAKDKSH